MPTFIIAGYQKSLAHQVRAALNEAKPHLQGWRWELFPGNEQSASRIAQGQVDKLLEFAAKHDGAHIFGINDQRQNAGTIPVGNLIRRYFRLRWLPSQAIGMLGGGQTGPLIAALASAIEEEIFWSDNVKPKDWSSPLMLPEIFKTTTDLTDMWNLSESYNDLKNLTAVVKKIDKFQSKHRQKISSGSKTPWVDEKQTWAWQDDGARHGTAIFPKTWKYSFHAPNFHYDVQSMRQKAIFVDSQGTQHSVKEYLNINAHGDVMSAK
jgi:hypothetical protein